MLDMGIPKNKKRIQITVPKEKYKELKDIAKKNNVTISDLLTSASDYIPDRIVKTIPIKK